MRFDAVTCNVADAFSQIVTFGKQVDSLRPRRSFASFPNPQNKIASFCIGEGNHLFKDLVSCSITNFPLAANPWVRAAVLSWKLPFVFDVLTFRDLVVQQFVHV